jgi:hypothetical protein
MVRTFKKKNVSLESFEESASQAVSTNGGFRTADDLSKYHTELFETGLQNKH